MVTEFGKGCTMHLVYFFSLVLYLLTNKLVHDLQDVLDFAKESWNEIKVVVWKVTD